MPAKLTKKQINELTNYWRKTAEHDFETLEALFKGKRYSDALFFGHIVLEKILKAHFVFYNVKQAPYTHDLLRLYEKSGLKLNKFEIEYLNRVNDFNIRARYPDFKLSFYKRATKSYAEKNIRTIRQLYKKLCLELEQKR